MLHYKAMFSQYSSNRTLFYCGFLTPLWQRCKKPFKQVVMCIVKSTNVCTVQNSCMVMGDSQLANFTKRTALPNMACDRVVQVLCHLHRQVACSRFFYRIQQSLLSFCISRQRFLKLGLQETNFSAAESYGLYL